MSNASALARIKANAAGALGFTPVNKAGDTMTGELTLQQGLLGSSGRKIILPNGALNAVDVGSYEALAGNGANGGWVFLGNDQGSAASGYARTYHQICKKVNGSAYSQIYEIHHRGDVNYYFGGSYLLKVNSWYSADRDNYHESVSLRCLNGRRDGISIYPFNNGQGIWVSANSAWGYIAIRKVGYTDRRDVGAAYCCCENGGALNGSVENTSLPAGALYTLNADGGYFIRGQTTFSG